MKLLKKQTRSWNYPIVGGITVLFILLLVAGLYLTQVVLLENAQELGNEVASRCSQEELASAQTAQSLLGLGTDLLASQADAGQEQRVQWAQTFFRTVSQWGDSTALVPQAVIQGALVTADTVTPASSLADLAWYQQAVQAQGALVTTGPRLEGGESVLTLAQACGQSGDVLALHLYLDRLVMASTADALPEGSSYYLCNSSGSLLYAESSLDVPRERLEEYARTLFDQIQDGQLDDAQEYIYGLTNEKRAVYFNTAENGWVSIITIPYSSLLGNLRQVFYGAMAVSGALLLFLLFLGLRERRLRRHMTRIHETVSVLGNQYYAIYRINWAQGTYDIVKGSEDLAQDLPPKGDYAQLLERFRRVIDEKTFESFQANFSLAHIRQLVEKDISNFGGDFLRRFGQEYHWVNARLLFDRALLPQEAILCVRHADQDKIQQRQQLEMLADALDRAKESEQSRDQFFSQMSHDMRTPLNVIIGTVQLALAQGQGEGTAGENLKKIQVSAQQLLELINDILEISRMERTDLRLHNDPCDLRQTIQQAVDLFRPQAELQKKTLLLTCALPRPKVLTDAFRLQQVLNNLLSNAMKFTGQGDTVQVTARQEEHQCVIAVKDTGIGMSPDFLPQLFTPYAREARFGTQSVLGTGLGMTIVHTIVQRMGGTIQVDSVLGVGTTFTLTLPMEPAPEAPAATPEQEQEDPKVFFQGKHLLVAEDFEMNLEILTQLLAMCGAQVTPARNGQEAVEAFQAAPPGTFDAILMDMNMPVLDGCGAARAIRALDRPDAAGVPIVAVTANAFAEDAAASARAGMNAHIPKPIDLNLLAKTLRQLAQRPS